MKTKSLIGKTLLKDMSIYALSEKTGIKVSQISAWINGKRQPTVKNCVRLSEGTGIPLENIVLLFAERPEFDTGK